MPREIPRVGHKDHDLGDVEDLIKAGCDRIKRLDELLRNKIREEKKIKERGRTLRKLIQFDLMNFIKPGLIGGEKTVEDTPTDPLSAEIFKNLAILQNSATGNPNLPRIEALKNMEQFLALCDAQEEAEGKLACRRFSDTVDDDNGFENIFPTECAQCSQDESDEELDARLAENEAIFSRSKIWTPVEEKEKEVNFPDDDKEPSHIHDSQAKDFIRRNIEMKQSSRQQLLPETRARKYGEVVNKLGKSSEVTAEMRTNQLCATYLLARKANQLMPQTDAEKARLEDLLAEDDYFTDTELLESVSSDMVNNSDDSLALLRGHSLATTGKFNVDQSSNSSSGSSANQWILWPYFDGQPTDALSESEPSVKSISQLSPNEFESVEPKECHRYSQTEEARTMFGRLSEIDKQLELLTQTREEYNHSAGSNGCSTTSSDEIVDSSKSPSPVRTRLGGPGEKVLEQAMQTRRQIHRLNEIDTQLAVIQKEDFEQ
ncbi:unnamed protein product [Calicophoron daubneyi]|uniref:Fibrous sheath-interacting protein 1 n=1 Tax=Calicophoron daubneyi TaxID=300641 RepID=A0AAV2TI61_CALDB